ncbi:MAG: hypothetical protein ACYTDT_10705 [Planctomycetota bacterium]|jgi:hypothetical protein
MPRLLLLALLTTSIFASPFAVAQDGLASPIASERSDALDDLGEEQRKHWRGVLDEGASAPHLVKALMFLEGLSKTEDIARIAKYVGDIDPFVSSTAASALRSFGRDAIQAVDAIPAGDLDPTVRKDLLDALLRDHIKRCCLRDMRLNPDRYSYEGRFDELFSVSHDIETLMYELVKNSRSTIAEDMDGRRNMYWRTPSQSMPFVDYGGLVIAALGHRSPVRLAEELKEVKDMEFENQRWWWSSRQRASATTATAIFFAHQGETRLIDKLIGDMQKSFRNSRKAEDLAGIHIQIATLEYVALGDTDMALDRIDENISNMAQADSDKTTRAYYLRARIKMAIGEDGSALSDLEQGIESSSSACAILNVDGAFDTLTSERRFKTIKQYVELKTRRLPESERPWQSDEDE